MKRRARWWPSRRLGKGCFDRFARGILWRGHFIEDRVNRWVRSGLPDAASDSGLVHLKAHERVALLADQLNTPELATVMFSKQGQTLRPHEPAPGLASQLLR